METDGGDGLFSCRKPLWRFRVTFEEALQQRHVALTRPALIDALRSSNPDVRALAAFEPIPVVKAALNAEVVPKSRIDIALALATVGDEAGFSALQRTCEDASMDMTVRVEGSKSVSAGLSTMEYGSQ